MPDPLLPARLVEEGAGARTAGPTGDGPAAALQASSLIQEGGEDSVGAAGRCQLPGTTTPQTAPNLGAWFAQESHGQEVRGWGAADPQQRESRVQSRETFGNLTHGSLMLSMAKNSKSGVAHIKSSYFFYPCDIILISQRSYNPA